MGFDVVPWTSCVRNKMTNKKIVVNAFQSALPLFGRLTVRLCAMPIISESRANEGQVFRCFESAALHSLSIAENVEHHGE